MEPFMRQPSPHPDAVKRWERLNKLTEELSELAAHIEAATYRLLLVIRELDKLGGWDDPSMPSLAHWLGWRIGLNLNAAREKVRVARALEELPLISEAFRKAEISYSKTRAMTRVATPENEKRLLNIAKYNPTSHIERVVRAWRNLDGIREREHADYQRRKRYLKMYTDEDGMVVIKGRLTPEVGAVLKRALDAAQDKLFQESDVSAEKRTEHFDEPYENRRSDALGLVAESALENDLDPGTRGDRYQVVVHVDKQVLEDPNKPGQSVLEDGPWISAETSIMHDPEVFTSAPCALRRQAAARKLRAVRRIACDASKVEIKYKEDGTPMDVGRKTRVVPAPLRRALEARDKACVFPGCNARIKVCDSHHLKHWADGGETKLSNLSLLCNRHHRCVHERGYGMERLPNGKLQFYRPDGRAMEAVPAPHQLSDDPVADLLAENEEEWNRNRLENHRSGMVGRPFAYR